MHSPFGCDWLCCRPELLPIATTYLIAGAQLDGESIVLLSGEVLRVVDEDEPCE